MHIDTHTELQTALKISCRDFPCNIKVSVHYILKINMQPCVLICGYFQNMAATLTVEISVIERMEKIT